jgi:hypothetical protein
MLVSKNLRDTLRYDGYAKLAAQIMRDQNEYVGDITDLMGGIKSVSVKIAVNRMNEQTIWDGLHAYQQLKGG